MKLSRGLGVVGYATGIVTCNFIGLLFGAEFMSIESIIMLSFVFEWCNDE